MDNVSINGNIYSHFNNNEYIKLVNIVYRQISISSKNCINLEGNVEIDNSQFYGSLSCQQRLFDFNGCNKYKLIIKNSYFSGENQCSCLNISNGKEVKIKNTTFENSHIFRENLDGGVMKLSNSYMNIINCKFFNNICLNNGGIFYLHNMLGFEAEGLEIFNSTALINGSMAYIRTENNKNKLIAKFRNIRQINTGNIPGMTSGGLILHLSNFASADIENYYAENLISNNVSGGAFYLADNSKLTIKNIEINKILGNGIDGLFITSYNAIDINISVTNYTLNDLKQNYSRQSAAFIWFDLKTTASFKHGNITNVNGENINLMYISDSCKVDIEDLYVDNFFSKTARALINSHSNEKEYSSFIANKLNLNNIKSQGAIIELLWSNAVITNSNIKNIHSCYLGNNCTSRRDGTLDEYEAEIGYLHGNCDLTFNNTKFENIYGVRGFSLINNQKLEINDSSFYNCYFKNGIFEINNEKSMDGKYVINNTNFTNINSENGSILHIKSIVKNSYSNVNIRNAIFQNNTASKFGGVLYSRLRTIYIRQRKFIKSV
jgi:predicted outer membrane repeat protein